MSLALRMGRTVAELEGSMTSAELTQWLAYFQVLEDRHGESDADRVAREEIENLRMQRFFAQLGVKGVRE